MLALIISFGNSNGDIKFDPTISGHQKAVTPILPKKITPSKKTDTGFHARFLFAFEFVIIDSP